MKFDLVRFGDYLSLEKGASYTSSNLAKESDIGLLTINAFKVGGGYKANSEKPFVGEVKEQFMLEEGDVLVAMTEQDAGLLASPLVVKIDQTNFDSLLYSLDVAKVIGINNQVDPKFVFNVLRIPAFRIRAAYGDTGSTVQRLPYEALKDLKIPKPPLQVQRAISALMDSIDEKLRVNRQIAANLESISQSIFKSWFIDFDPVKAKMAGDKPLGMDASTAALFPASFETSESGEIPSGWESSTVEKFCPFVYGKSLPAGVRVPGDVPVYGSNGIVGIHNVPLVRRPTVVIGRKGTVGTVHLEMSPSWIIDTAFYTNTAKDDDVFLAYLSLKGLGLESMNSDGAVPGLNRDNAHRLPVTIGNPSIRNAFSQLVKPFFELSHQLMIQNSDLCQVRDSLLPRLISGELQIPEEMLAS